MFIAFWCYSVFLCYWFSVLGNMQWCTVASLHLLIKARFIHFSLNSAFTDFTLVA